jgi:ankyrin repeat protein
MLLEFGDFDINAQVKIVRHHSTFGYNAIMYACKHGNLPLVKMLVQSSEDKIDFNATNSSGCTCLMISVETGKYDVVKYLLAQPKVNPNIIAGSILDDHFNNSPKSALTLAMVNGFEEIVALLLARSDMDTRYAYHRTLTTNSNIIAMVNEYREKQILEKFRKLTIKE